MRFCLLSDSHGDTSQLIKLSEQIPPVDMFIHVGDYASDVKVLEKLTGFPACAVLGNTDRQRHGYKLDEFLEINNYLLWLTHGHQYLNSYYDLCALADQAKVFQAQIVIFGHTHIPHIQTIDNILLINPGSISLPRRGYPSYALLELYQQPLTTLCELK